ncbi:hypothetical protein [Jiangella anatolica]|uniref:Uncharacterized protein n=1 Tax=Jiangella anatolica TaxID=2670374 RepID=A0A2W2CB13_9ACTN|nr:hypothetical protein [Jiangella anatolica]PZF85457.1 hypothetical protein C1I92_04920 [Jiangella anatolica]
MQWGRFLVGTLVCGALVVLVVQLVSSWSPVDDAGGEPADSGISGSGASGSPGSYGPVEGEQCPDGWQWMSPSDAANAPGGVMVECPAG